MRSPRRTRSTSASPSATGGDAMVGGDLDVKTDDVTFEEPKVVADAEDEDDAEERSLWGDGDDEPGSED